MLFRSDKHHMVQMNYSCLPNENGALKGATRLSRSVGMDIDFDPKAPDYEAKMAQVPELVMGNKEELGLLMLERSANKGYHIVFRRRLGLSQEENLKWASRLLGVEYDKGAKDITRVFFTPPTDRLLYLDKELFDNGEAEVTEELKQGGAEASQASGQALQASAEGSQVSQASAQPSAQGSQATAGEAYLGIPYALIIDRWWAMYNDGQTPVRSNRNTLTFELAVNLRHICGFDRKVLDRVIPCYDGLDRKSVV